MVEATGVAIFLGGNGWGPTHLWEAERALARYRSDPRFKLIPVALPGIDAGDMGRLGAGKVFQEINWADFTKGSEDRDSLGKLEAALSGRELPQYRGPARLTPYQVRRDAERWTRAKGRDRSILYKGAQLEQAFDLVQGNPDYVVADEVLPFLNAARASQRRFWRRLAAVGSSTALALTMLSVGIYSSYRLAERRRVASLSRQLAIASQEAPGADRRLLIATRAALTERSAEARGALLESLENWRELRCIAYVGSGVNAVITESGLAVVLAAADDGSVRYIRDGSVGQGALPRTGGGAATALARSATGIVFVGRESGGVEALSAGSRGTILQAPTNLPAKRNLSVRSLALRPDASLLAVGTGSGRLAMVDPIRGRVVREIDEGGDVALVALSFSEDGAWLAVGTSLGEIIFLDGNGSERQRCGGLDGGVLAPGFAPDGTLRAVTGHGLLVNFRRKGDAFERTTSRHVGDMLTAVAFDDSGSLVAVGDGSGTVRVMSGHGESTGFGKAGAHASSVMALDFAPDGTLVSGSSDGTLAVWDLSGASGLSRPLPDLASTVNAVRLRPDGTLVAATVTKGRAEIVRLVAGRWVRELDILSVTRDTLGPAASRKDDDDVPPGFESMNTEVPWVAMDASASRIAWTAGGTALWQDLGVGRPAATLGPADEASEVALSPDGHRIAVIAPGRMAVKLFELRTGEPSMRSLRLPAQGRSLAFDPSGGRIAVGLENGTIAISRASGDWRIETRTTPRHHSAAAGIGYTSDGEKLVTFGSGGGGTDRSIVVTDSESLASPRRLQSRLPGGSVAAMALGAGTGLIAAADQNGAVLLWDLAELRFVATVRAGTTSVPALALDGASARMVTSSIDGGFRTWDLDVEQWIRLACAKANRDLRPDEWAKLLPGDPMQATCAHSD